MLIELLLASVIIMFASLVGVFAAWKQFGAFMERNAPFLVSFAAGVFLILVYRLMIEVLSESSTVTVGIFWILVGLIGITLIVKVLPQSHHHHIEDTEEHPHGRLDARRMLIADSFHNAGDGILLAAAFAISSTLGFATALSVFIHELVQEISEFFVLRQAGYEPKQALKINFLTSATVLIGAVGGFFLLDQFKIFEVPILGFATGALIALLLQDIIPHSIHHAISKKCTRKHITAVILGAIIMFTLFTLIPETHVPEDLSTKTIVVHRI